VFVVYDNIQYTKKGWINRNRMLQNGSDAMFSLPLKSDADGLDVRERRLAASFDRGKLLRQFEGAYRRAPHFDQTFALLRRIVLNEADNLFDYLRGSIQATCEHLGLATRLQVSSQVAIDHAMKAQDKVLAMCSALGADTYVNPIGGTDLYDKAAFAARGVELRFIKSLPWEYPQLGAPFVPWLSIADVLMFNPLPTVRERVAGHYEMQ
jgi:hypothetical protein